MSVPFRGVFAVSPMRVLLGGLLLVGLTAACTPEGAAPVVTRHAPVSDAAIAAELPPEAAIAILNEEATRSAAACPYLKPLGSDCSVQTKLNQQIQCRFSPDGVVLHQFRGTAFQPYRSTPIPYGDVKFQVAEVTQDQIQAEPTIGLHPRLKTDPQIVCFLTHRSIPSGQQRPVIMEQMKRLSTALTALGATNAP